MALSVRTRFEVFKCDDFTCQYCGRKSPDTVLEIDHIVPRCENGSDDPINLRTSCWDCNRGKADRPLNELVTGEDPHDKAIELLERERQLREYNAVVAKERKRCEREARAFFRYWTGKLRGRGNEADRRWLVTALKWCPVEVIREYMNVSIDRECWHNLKYVAGCCYNWRREHMPTAPQEGRTTPNDV